MPRRTNSQRVQATIDEIRATGCYLGRELTREAYPRTAAECIDDGIRFKPEVLQAIKRFKREKPWRGSLAERMDKFISIHNQLCSIYGIDVELRFVGVDQNSFSGSSCFIPSEMRIELRGKLSVITYLHEFAHALGRGERGACRWSLNLFKRMFPRSWGNLEFEGHVARRP